MSGDRAEITEDAFLGGKLRLRQPRRGHRAGHDAVLLAAATAAQAGERVVDFGAGVGAAGLAVATRVRGIELTLVEIDDALADLARDNAALNRLAARVAVLDVAAPAQAFVAAGLPPDSADRVLMNPPFNRPSRHQASPDSVRRAAHEGTEATLEVWVHAARRLLKPNGTLTLIWRADDLADVLAALGRGFGGIVILPVHPTSKASAIRILVKAIKGDSALLVILPGLVLNDAAGTTIPDIQAVLNGDAVLRLAGD